MNNFKIIILSIILYSSNCFSQGIDESNINFFIVDTISINNPVVFYDSNISGKFICDLEILKKSSHRLKKVVKNDEVFIFEQDMYRFMNSELEIEKYDYPDYGNCKFQNDYFKNIKGFTYQKFETFPQKYILGLINVSYYNSKITTYGKKQSVFKKYDKSIYYRIVFPLCE